MDYLGKRMFFLLLDSKILLYNYEKKLNFISDETYKLQPACKVLEGFLKKLIKQKKLRQSEEDNIGDVFGNKQGTLRTKIKDRRLIAKTKTVWDFCRNEVVHYDENKNYYSGDLINKFNQITEIMILLFEDFYKASKPDDEIKKGLNDYTLRDIKTTKYKIKNKIVNFVNKF
jgi:hypothetical protein